jgi:hypothetical protein
LHATSLCIAQTCGFKAKQRRSPENYSVKTKGWSCQSLMHPFRSNDAHVLIVFLKEMPYK